MWLGIRKAEGVAQWRGKQKGRRRKKRRRRRVGKEGKKPPILPRVLLGVLLLSLAYVVTSALSMACNSAVMVVGGAAGLFLRVLLPRSCEGNHDAVDDVN